MKLNLLALLILGFSPMIASADPIGSANNRLTLKLYGRLKGEPGNVFYSPLSLRSALAMTALGAEGATLAQMFEALELGKPDPKAHEELGASLRELNKKGNAEKFQLQVANALWTQKDFPLLPGFVQANRAHYDVHVQELDFAKADAARQKINQWISGRTKKKIPELIPTGLLNAQTKLVLTNAVYFKGAWASPFSPKSVKTEPFFLADGKRASAEMMSQTHSFRYFEDDLAQVLELPYVSNQASMWVVLPKGSLPELEGKLTAEILESWDSKLAKREVRLSLPKWKVKAGYSLNDHLAALGMTDAFDGTKANFSAMSSRGGLVVSAVIHQAFVSVDEQGTEAAAATAVSKMLTALPKDLPVHFRADRPFLYLIRDQASGAVLFIGRIMNPEL